MTGALDGSLRKTSEPSTLQLLEDTLSYAREREYTGWDYGDGTSSRLCQLLPDHRWVNLAFQETAKRAPVNLRPLLLVEQRRNFKGSALFTMANLRAAELTDESRYREEARELADWLVEWRTEGYSGYCGGHAHDLQGLESKTEARTPGIVGTSYAVKALLRADDEFDSKPDDAPGGSYAGIARTAADFVFEDLGYETAGPEARIDYKPDEPDDYHTLNAVALGARLLVDLYERFGDRRYREGARKILNYVAARQTEEGGWMYREPPSTSHLSMDNHHNGFIVECLQRYHEVVGPRYEHTLDRALSFYREALFEPNGAPNWDESSAYPRDVHASAQGILVFAYAGEFEFAERILEWTLDHLYAGHGRFYFRKHHLFTKRYTLMRWCQAWMAYAVAELLAERSRAGG